MSDVLESMNVPPGVAASVNCMASMSWAWYSSRVRDVIGSDMTAGVASWANAGQGMRQRGAADRGAGQQAAAGQGQRQGAGSMLKHPSLHFFCGWRPPRLARVTSACGQYTA